MILRPADIAEIHKHITYDQVKNYLRNMPHTGTRGPKGKHLVYEDIHIDAVKFAHEFRMRLGLRHNDASALGFRMAKNMVEQKNKTWTTINGIVIGVPNEEA